ncbi:hypothetical protein EDC94DRAFT_584280 [Helicostylum pulchrum]|nr:hypothetical protein EDC94DRAFT_584280 [Helicostylum pulchrum]
MFLLGCSVEVLVSLVNTGIIGGGSSYRRGTVETWSRGGVYQAQRSQRLKEPSTRRIVVLSSSLVIAIELREDPEVHQANTHSRGCSSKAQCRSQHSSEKNSRAQLSSIKRYFSSSITSDGRDMV